MKYANKRNILTEKQESRMALEKRDFPSESGNVDTGMSWTERKSNEEVLNKLLNGEERITKASSKHKPSYFGYNARHESLQQTTLSRRDG